jgi:hypothetical protein
LALAGIAIAKAATPAARNSLVIKNSSQGFKRVEPQHVPPLTELPLQLGVSV